jgi:uncharacterized protein (DUF2126 family)/transglutaminase-like putative cysteine protease
MTVTVSIHHRTAYRFPGTVTLTPHVFRLRPAAHSRTSILSYSLHIGPGSHFINWQQDPFGNHLARVVFPDKTDHLTVDVEVVAAMTAINPFDFFLETYAERIPFTYPEQLRRELAPYLETREGGLLLRSFLAGIDRTPRGAVDFLVDVNRAVQQQVAYTLRMEAGVQTCEETLRLRLGSCRDSAWLLVQALRHLGLAARFVSGYLVQLATDQAPLDGAPGPAADFTDLHAWAEVYIPGAGWIGMDATSGLFAGEGHIPLACTADYVSAAPVSGGYIGPPGSTLEFQNRVTRSHEDPRVTLPYSESQWASIMALGDAVDAELKAGDVRLTMGGEPTFVSIDEPHAPEWNTEADGAAKRVLAGRLLRNLREAFAPGGLLYHGQGKWYPGEPLPRWQKACLWRRDAAPVWRSVDLLADPHVPGQTAPPCAEGFVRELARVLGLRGSHVMAAYEDPLTALQQESMLPVNLTHDQPELHRDAGRRRLVDVLQRGLGQAVGWVLPLHWSHRSRRWHSSPWTFRRGAMYLLPGDSPLGLRMPLDALPWVPFEAQDHEPERSLFEAAPALGDPQARARGRRKAGNAGMSTDQPVDPVWSPHTAVAAEVRNGHLHVFLPPLSELEQYLDLIASVEHAAASLALPVVIEGYQPPHDVRLLRLPVTPDPGVIEVNIHPAASWRELVHNTTVLYEVARRCRLGTEKFELDGRHTGTGGGNHVTLGGPTPADSPMLRRPDLLRSLITFWQHHPSLSYLFSGSFIGPTSQAPRVDEARHDALYELEIAFQQMPRGEVPAPWLVDRLLRNLLVDMTGNTHRSEFCIDKLYAPGSDAGRLGLLELRAFEMPPHAQMSLMQGLLLRALVARFWKTPYERPLVHWGTQLHDRFMLPHFVESDLRNLIGELDHAGYPFHIDWFRPFLEFRFPRIGTVRAEDLVLELRQAIEPWHVLGEEVTRSGTARFVDSSVERLQVSLDGASGERYRVLCNGRPLPLRPVATVDRRVAGVRYRAWCPPSALHPTIPVQAPLVFDIVDDWSGMVIGGCTYHVAHPGGRNHAQRPVNALEAEGRRNARFWGHGHTPGRPPEAVSTDPENPHFPFTLDLRWHASSARS